MPDRTQDLKNHRQVAVACKNYTDSEIKKSEGRILSIVARNNVNYIDHIDEASYKITAPTNAKLMMLQSIGGNTVKLSPSVASDSTKAMIKTMPSTVYTFDGSKFYGNSEVINKFNSTIEQGVINGATGEPITSNERIRTKDYITLSSGTYTISWLEALQVVIYVYDTSNTYQSGESVLTWQNSGYSFTLTANRKVKFAWKNADGTALLPSAISNIMLNSGSSALPYIPNGINNLELSGLKVEGNLFDKDNYTYSNAYISGSGTKQNDTNNSMVDTMIEVEPNQTYTLSVNATQYGLTVVYYNDNTFISRQLSNSNVSSFIFTTPYNCNGIKFFMNHNQATISANYLSTIEPMLYKGSTTPTTYQPYVAPTTKTIDLSTILYNGSPLFEGNSLKKVNTAIDYLTPYKAHKEIGTQTNITITGLSSLSNETNSFFSFAKGTGIDKTKGNYASNYVCDKFDLTQQYGNLNDATLQNKIITNINIDNAYLCLPAGTTIEQAQTLINETTILYILETPIEVSIDLSATLRNIQGYPNGSIIAENTHNMDVESVITYNSIIQETLCPSVTVDGFNVWNEEWGNYHWVNGVRTTYATGVGCKNPISVKAGETYYFKRPSGVNAGYVYLDSNENLVGNGEQYLISGNNTLTIPSGVSYLCFWLNNYGATYNHDICINISGSFDGNYKPYKASITRNLPTQASDGWSAGTQRNYRVFSDYEGNEVLKRETNVGKELVGSLSYIYDSTNLFFRCNNITTKAFEGSVIGNFLTKSYLTVSQVTANYKDDLEVFGLSWANTFGIRDETYANNVTTFKLKNTNEPLYYELADASKTETDMDDFDYFFDVEEGDVITFNNPYAQQVYATYSFIIKEAKSNE